MTFITHNHEQINTADAVYQGCVAASIDELVSLFGLPETKPGSGGADHTWKVRFNDGTVSTVYDSDAPNRWHVGGKGKQSVDLVQIALDLHRESQEDKPTDSITEIMHSMRDMMETISKQRGENYARAVEVAVLTMKQIEIVHQLLSRLVKTGDMPPKLADTVAEAFNIMASKNISAAAHYAMPDSPKQADAAELMGWARKITEIEERGADILYQKLRGSERGQMQ